MPGAQFSCSWMSLPVSGRISVGRVPTPVVARCSKGIHGDCHGLFGQREFWARVGQARSLHNLPICRADKSVEAERWQEYPSSL